MTHNLVTNYGLLDKMDVFVRRPLLLPALFPLHLVAFLYADLQNLSLASYLSWYILLQRPTRATNLQMTRFHSDEYIDFLERVTPETVEELTGNGTRCESSFIQYTGADISLLRVGKGWA